MSAPHPVLGFPHLSDRLTAHPPGLPYLQVLALARELLGGNGIVADFHVAKAFCDLEAIYTYEGTYDINMLVAGRESTGVAAFSPPLPKMAS